MGREKTEKIKMGDSQSGGGTPLSEVRLEEKRIALRRALKREYMRQYYGPENQGYTGKQVFDAAFHRYNALQNSQVKMVKMNFGNFLIWAGTFAIPTYIAWTWYCGHQVTFYSRLLHLVFFISNAGKMRLVWIFTIF